MLVFTSNKKILTQLNLLWGVKAFFYDGTESTDRTVEEINRIAVENNYLQNVPTNVSGDLQLFGLNKTNRQMIWNLE